MILRNVDNFDILVTAIEEVSLPHNGTGRSPIGFSIITKLKDGNFHAIQF